MNNSRPSFTNNSNRLAIPNLTHGQPSASGPSYQSAAAGPATPPTFFNNGSAPISIDDDDDDVHDNDTPLTPVTPPTPAAAPGTITIPPTLRLPNIDAEGRRTVIDLTADSPPREVIDVDALPDTPDVEYQFSRPAVNRVPPHVVPPHPGVPHQAGYMGNVANMNNRFYDNRPHPPANYNPGGINAGRFLHQIVQVMNGNRGFGAASMGLGGQERDGGLLFRGQRIDVFGVPGAGVAFNPPGVLDYRQGAHGVLPGTPPAEERPNYVKPKEAREGYTRDPTSETTVVCPMCDHELGENNGDKLQAKVWVGKCGHVSFFLSTDIPKTKKK